MLDHDCLVITGQWRCWGNRRAVGPIRRKPDGRNIAGLGPYLMFLKLKQLISSHRPEPPKKSILDDVDFKKETAFMAEILAKNPRPNAPNVDQSNW